MVLDVAFVEVLRVLHRQADLMVVREPALKMAQLSAFDRMLEPGGDLMAPAPFGRDVASIPRQAWINHPGRCVYPGCPPRTGAYMQALTLSMGPLVKNASSALVFGDLEYRADT